jgi:hypothetical protein
LSGAACAYEAPMGSSVDATAASDASNTFMNRTPRLS